MLTEAKISLSISIKKIHAKALMALYLKERCWLEHHQQLSFKYFVKSLSIQKLLSKVSSIQTTISGGTLKY